MGSTHFHSHLLSLFQEIELWLWVIHTCTRFLTLTVVSMHDQCIMNKAVYMLFL